MLCFVAAIFPAASKIELLLGATDNSSLPSGVPDIPKVSAYTLPLRLVIVDGFGLVNLLNPFAMDRVKSFVVSVPLPVSLA